MYNVVISPSSNADLFNALKYTSSTDSMVAREFRRVAYTGTMGWRQQIVRPAHEVALGIWLARLQPDPSLPKCAQTRQNAPVRPPAVKAASSPTPAQGKRLAALDALLAEGLVTQEEYDAKRREILEAKP